MNKPAADAAPKPQPEPHARVRRPYPRTAPCAIECRGDGNQVSAMIGNSKSTNIQESLVGYGDTLPDALRSLADELEREVGQEPEPQDTELRNVSDDKKRDEVYRQIKEWVWKQYPGGWHDGRVVDFVLWREEQEIARAQKEKP